MDEQQQGRPHERLADPQLQQDENAGGRLEDVDAASDADVRRRDLRAEIGKYVSLAGFPASPAQLIDEVAMLGAPDVVLAALRRVPPDTHLAGVHDLWTALGLEATNRF
jgi:hypothetical protein